MPDDIAVRVENLGKRYVIGREPPRAGTLMGRLRQTLASPFSWLSSQLRGPSEEEILWALKGVSFEVKRGEVLGVIGRNGAGKSTLLKILSRITEPTTGHAEMHGRIGALLEVGTGMHPELTGRENVYLNGTIIGMRKAEIDSRFDEIVDFSGVERFLDTPVKRYSSGMRVRLGFAIAAHLEPEILIVDEVLAVGDAEFQKKCLGKMRDVAGHGRTVLFVSHNMAAVRSLCSAVMLISAGKAGPVGLPDQVIQLYVDASATPAVGKTREPISRSGSGAVRLLSISARLAEGGSPVIATGDDVQFVVSFEAPPESIGKTLDVGFSLHDQYGDAISIFYSSYSSAKMIIRHCVGEVVCTVRSLPLSPGSYQMGVRALVGGIEADWPQGFLSSFEVSQDIPLYGGRRTHSGVARIILPAAWSMAAEE